MDSWCPHFNDSRSLMIVEWKDKAKRTCFFKSSSIYLIMKQFLEIYVVNLTFLTSYSNSLTESLFNLEIDIYSSFFYSYSSASTIYSSFWRSKHQSSIQILIKELLSISAFSFLASFNSTHPRFPSTYPSLISKSSALMGFPSLFFLIPRVIPDMRCLRI